MLLLPGRGQEQLSLCSLSLSFSLTPSFTFLSASHSNQFLSFPMRSSTFSTLGLIRSISVSLTNQHHHYRRRPCSVRHIFTAPLSTSISQKLPPLAASAASTFVKQQEGETGTPSPADSEEQWDHSVNKDPEGFDFDKSFESVDLKHLGTPALEVQELDELPEQWRRSKLAWLCKELPSHKPGTLIRVLNAQRKWVRQDDATYVAVHCMRIRENDTGFRVYKWMMQQSWYRFDFSIATKLADYMGKERKFSKCREIFDDIINQGRVPSESTFHILIVAYLSAPVQGCLEEACSIYNRMIQLGGYQPRLSLHNSLFKALVSKPGVSSKHHLNQAEFIFHQLLTTGLEIHKDIYGGLIWLHSYQDVIDQERIASIRKEMKRAGVEEGREVVLSILRASSKNGDVEEAQRCWLKLVGSEGGIPSQAFVYKMEVYAKAGEPRKALEIFREMKGQLGSASVGAYHKIIEVLCKAQEMELAEAIMVELVNSILKPLMPCYIDLMNMYFNLDLHDKLELAFLECLAKCKPNRTIYSIYLDSLVKVNNLGKAEEIFNQMQSNAAIGINVRSCNTILKGYLRLGEFPKAERVYDLMCQKKYDIHPPLMEKLEYVLSLSRKDVKKPVSLKLSKEQREILVGLLLGGLQIESDEERKNHRIVFEFNANSGSHSVLKRNIHEQYHEWLHPSFKPSDEDDENEPPYIFSTISHSYFGFYADQFWPSGRPEIPKLIHRWLSPCALAYWYMYGGQKTSSGDIVLKLKGSQEGVEKIVKSLKAKSLDCRVKRKGRVYWIGILGSNSTWFWKLIEPYVLDELKHVLKPSDQMGTQNIGFDSASESDEEEASNYTGEEKSH